MTTLLLFMAVASGAFPSASSSASGPTCSTKADNLLANQPEPDPDLRASAGEGLMRIALAAVTSVLVFSTGPAVLRESKLGRVRGSIHRHGHRLRGAPRGWRRPLLPLDVGGVTMSLEGESTNGAHCKPSVVEELAFLRGENADLRRWIEELEGDKRKLWRLLNP
jgi:hypothetical protein